MLEEIQTENHELVKGVPLPANLGAVVLQRVAFLESILQASALSLEVKSKEEEIFERESFSDSLVLERVEMFNLWHCD
jgi:hypothetical protein